MTRRIQNIFTGILLIGALFQYGCGGGGGGGSAAVNEPPPLTGTIISKAASLSGGEEVPPVTTSASGTGILDVSITTGAVRGSVTLQASPPLTSVRAVHVHEGARGVNGAIVIALENAGNNVWNVPAGITLTTSRVTSFTAGNLYFNVRTDAHPDGELRGQIDQ